MDVDPDALAFGYWKTCRIVVLLIAASGCASSAESPSEGGGPTGLARFFDAPPDDQALVGVGVWETRRLSPQVAPEVRPAHAGSGLGA